MYLISLDPTQGHEIQKTRPCLVISPDEMNPYLKTVIIAPMTTQGRLYPTRVPCVFENKKGLIVLDQIRSVDRSRLIKRLGQISPSTRARVARSLQEMFAMV